jgi:hypothetical protein
LFPIFFEEEFCDIGDPVTYKKRRRHINGIVQVAKQHDKAKEYRKSKEQKPPESVPPQNNRHKKRKSYVAGKKQVIAGKNTGKHSGKHARGYGDMFGIWAYVSKGNKTRADDDKQGDAFEYERGASQFKAACQKNECNQ